MKHWKQSEIIIRKAIEQYNPHKIILMVSGGHDSITNAHLSANYLKSILYPFEVYHGDTTISIPETRQYVENICELYGWKLNIGRSPNPDDHYESLVAKGGFPGPTKRSHQIMYRRLKERALNHFVTHQCKSGPLKRENVLLLSGVRQQESKIRMGYRHVTSKDRSKVWVNPIFYWSASDCQQYMEAMEIPANPVKVTMGISGECLCGCFSSESEWNNLQKFYPHVAAKIEEMHDKAKSNGFPWPWHKGPTQFKIEKEKSRQCKINFMCASCG